MCCIRIVLYFETGVVKITRCIYSTSYSSSRRLSPPTMVSGIVSNPMLLRLPCLVCPPHLTPLFPYTNFTSRSTWFSVFLSVSFMVLCVCNIRLSTCHSSLHFTCQCHSTTFSVIFLSLVLLLMMPL